jgi:Zn-dependent M28 family amino/carboxypeptidase
MSEILQNNASVGSIYTSQFGWNVLEDLTEYGARLGASDGERAGHERVKTAFEELGARDCSFQEFSMPHWDRETATLNLTVPRERSFNCIALPGSPAGSETAEIVHLDYGIPRDFDEHDLDGKIVVARSDVPDEYDRWLHRREKYYRAYHEGASGFIYQNHVPGCLPPTGSLGGGADVLGPIPAVGVSKEVGNRLAKYAEHNRLEGELAVDVTITEGSSQNVLGTVGPDTDEEILIGAHVDGHDISEGAIDNASGVAVLCEVGRALTDIEDALETKVRLIGWGSEEFGLIGSQHYAANTDLSRVKVALNCDGGLGVAREGLVYTCGFEGLRDAVETVGQDLQHPVSTDPDLSPHSDHWPFVWRGVPGAQIRADTGDSRGWGHTHADTIDKVDIRAIRYHAIFTTLLARHISDSTVSFNRRSVESIKNELVADDLEVPMKTAGDWPYEDA